MNSGCHFTTPGLADRHTGSGVTWALALALSHVSKLQHLLVTHFPSSVQWG